MLKLSSISSFSQMRPHKFQNNKRDKDASTKLCILEGNSPYDMSESKEMELN